MILITSAAFVTPELQAELGKLPPALLPIGNRRLYEHQVAVIKEIAANPAIYLSLPDTYSISEEDEILLKSLEVEILRIEDGLSLGESIQYAINSIGIYDETLRILHGDTLLLEAPKEDDFVAISEAEDDYAWEIQSSSAKHSDVVWCGYFSFQDIKLFSKCLANTRYRFVEAVRAYGEIRPLKYGFVDNWLDLGHVNTYFRSRSEITTQRSFNSLSVTGGIVRKSGSDSAKLRAEASWYQQLPPRLKRFTPQFLGDGETTDGFYYETEYLPLLPLNELYVHGSLPGSFWRRVVTLADQVLSEFQNHDQGTQKNLEMLSDFEKLVINKTDERLNKFSRASGFSLTSKSCLNGTSLPSLSEIARACMDSAVSLPCYPGILHGDFCFSNILYDSRSNTLKVLDPRGLDASGESTIFGNLVYDIAKFYHSLYGYYDHIIAGRYSLVEVGGASFDFRVHTDERFAINNGDCEDEVSLLGLPFSEMRPLVIVLFLSMLPLHADDPRRQKALLANAMRIYSRWIGG